MATQLQLDDIRRAWEARDPELIKFVELMATQPDPQPDKPIREGAMTFARFLREINSYQFRKKTPEEQMHWRVEQLKALEAPDAEVPLSDKLRLHEIILALWNDNGPFARRCLLRIIATVELTYGPWRALKRIFKEAEARNDTEILGALAARFDMAISRSRFKINRLTMAYLVRRAWRYLRRLAVRLPAAYADAAVDFLAAYTDDCYWNNTWIANHIFYHETKEYSRASFRFHTKPASILKFRAFAELWQRTPRPLFSLLERARAEQVWAFATEALKTDFRQQLREVEPEWVVRLLNVGSASIDDFVVWILNNVPCFEQGAFRTLGLHDAVLKLFDSKSNEARRYAADYARTHARDLPVPELIRLANNSFDAVRKLAADLLQSRDPRTEVGLDAWGQLLETQYGSQLAQTVIKKSFGARELTPEWFKARLLSGNQNAFNFAKGLLPQIHPFQKLGPQFFADLIDSLKQTSGPAAWNVPNFALGELAKFDVNALDLEFLKRLLLNPVTRRTAIAWVNEGRLKARTFPVEFLKVVAFHPDWEEDQWVATLKQSGREWAKDLNYDEGLANSVIEWLKDVRRFTPADLGFDWLMKLVARSEERYHDFAVDTMVRSFAPADFAPRAVTTAKKAAAEAAAIDLTGSSFCFTGKMATMGRKEAEGKVKAAGGTASTTVTKKLHYLVIGDEGSPLLGEGKKSDKHIKAEEINEAGGNIQIISETAFLRMLSGEKREYSEDAALAGAERLWEMAIAPGNEDVALGRFARRYIRRHHPDVGMEETDRPVDAEAAIPASFFTYERFEPLFHETRKPLREFALKFAKWEFARWSPPIEKLLRLAESPFSEVRQFVAQALLADDAPEHKRYRIDPASLSPSAVYSFCESPDEATRELGMKLIERHPRLKLPEELFRLTESPDRKVRAFVIRELWALYRDRGITPDWKPYIPPKPTIGAAAKKAAAEETQSRGEGAPHRPEKLPTDPESMRAFFRRILFEIPPGRSESKKGEGEDAGITIRVKPLPARRAKLHLVEVMRDLA
ncbi:MAG TPA: BRCT domain-containing protein, partial [Gemmataceae bacterium]|nr:BRCT domain-containing protein [Gemmataceae bacterium]